MIPYVAQREKAAKENSKRKSKSQSKMHGVSSSAVDKDERRKQQNRDSSRASDAGKKERRAALSDYYVRESVLGEEKDLHLLSLREKNADLSDRMYRKHKH